MSSRIVTRIRSIRPCGAFVAPIPFLGGSNLHCNWIGLLIAFSGHSLSVTLRPTHEVKMAKTDCDAGWRLRIKVDCGLRLDS